MKMEIDIRGYQNIESFVSLTLRKKEYKRELINVTFDGKNLVLEFSKDYSSTAKAFVKQFAKKKYSSIEEACSKAFDERQIRDLAILEFKKISVVETRKVWLVFWAKP